MPIKKHVTKVGENNTITIPKTISDALGISEGVVLRIYSNNNGYSFTVETVSTYEQVTQLEMYKQKYEEERAKREEAERKYAELTATAKEIIHGVKSVVEGE